MAKCHVLSSKKNQVVCFFFARKSKDKKVKAFFSSLEGTHFHDSVIFKNKTKKTQNMFLTKPSAKQATHLLKYSLSLDWYSVENVFDFYYHYKAKTIGNFFALTVG